MSVEGFILVLRGALTTSMGTTTVCDASEAQSPPAPAASPTAVVSGKPILVVVPRTAPNHEGSGFRVQG